MKDRLQEQGFYRTLLKEEATLISEAALGLGSFSFCEVSPLKISLFQYRKPFEILSFTDGLSNKNTFRLNLDTTIDQFTGMNAVSINDSSSILLSGRTAMGYRTETGDLGFDKSQLDNTPFYHSEVLNNNSFLLMSKVMHQGVARRKLKKVNWAGMELAHYLPKMQVDGYFCTDGQFRYDNTSHRIIYMYYYRGEFICLDTNLTVLYQTKTIDTVTHANLSLEKSNASTTQSTAPNIVNRRFCIGGDKIYIQSEIKSDNESERDFLNFYVIDMYMLQDGKYAGSFYLPKFGRQKLTKLAAFDKTFIALYKDRLALFKVPVIK